MLSWNMPSNSTTARTYLPCEALMTEGRYRLCQSLEKSISFAEVSTVGNVCVIFFRTYCIRRPPVSRFQPSKQASGKPSRFVSPQSRTLTSLFDSGQMIRGMALCYANILVCSCPNADDDHMTGIPWCATCCRMWSSIGRNSSFWRTYSAS
jgi:hypothetical protein